jgi:hypothetical protein
VKQPTDFIVGAVYWTAGWETADKLYCWRSLLLLTNRKCFSDLNHLSVAKLKQSQYRPAQAQRFQEVEVPRFKDNQHMKVVRLTTLRTGHLNPQEVFLVLISFGG